MDMRRIRLVWLGVIVLGLLAACGAAGGGSANNPDAPVTNTSSDAPNDPNAPVTGFPGQPGGAASAPAIRGRVLDATGQPVVGVLVLPESTDSPSQAIPEIAVMTNERGEYQWSLPPGSYTLRFTAEGYASRAEAVQVVAGQSATLDVTLQQP